MGDLNKLEDFFSRHDIIKYFVERILVLLVLLFILLLLIACNPTNKDNNNNNNNNVGITTNYSFDAEWGITKENDNIIVGLYKLEDKQKTNIRLFSFSCNAKDQSIKNTVLGKEYFEFGNIKIKEFKFTNGLINTDSSTLVPILDNYSKIINSLDTNNKFEIILNNKDKVNITISNKNFILPCK